MIYYLTHSDDFFCVTKKRQQLLLHLNVVEICSRKTSLTKKELHLLVWLGGEYV